MTGRAEQALLTPAEVARAFRVDPKTVARWATSGKLSAVRTLGGHRRFYAAEIEALLRGECRGTLETNRTNSANLHKVRYRRYVPAGQKGFLSPRPGGRVRPR
ncbi:BldC family transcriptional regulator [Cellulosimicrobium cellulans]|nr:BldC family transcriptional regulator [Cellulosimicrobium cellulans]